jgi:hypothetical protein
MGCCGKRRAAFRNTVAMAPRPVSDQAVRLRYIHPVTASFRGGATGRTYMFSPAEPVRAVHLADADSLLQTGHFRVAS